jgi:hypothetical protein
MNLQLKILFDGVEQEQVVSYTVIRGGIFAPEADAYTPANMRIMIAGKMKPSCRREKRLPRKFRAYVKGQFFDGNSVVQAP